jgi:RHS repeat-associated protein
VTGASIGTSIYPTEVDAQWPATSDDPNGVGVWEYQIYRNGTYWGGTTSTSFADKGLSPGTAYTYTIYALDWHLNKSAGTSFSATTPGYGPNPAVVTPPARTGVHSLGSYWGAAGEQIDMLSGNLNFTVPLLRAMGRGVWGQTFALNYNSQLWRLDSGGTWNLGKDVGYGWGWRLMAGSIAPYWSDAYTIQYYLFTDYTGAEYKLDINTNGIWTSSQGAYVSYDGANQLLYFPDGSFWTMGCYSAGTEPDAGNRYPTIMQDTNGNQVLIRYQTGAGAPWANSSARITEIEDVRAVLNTSTGTYRTWAFTYDNTGPTPHLSGISNYILTAESYNFTYLTNQSLASPFSPPVSYPATTLLQIVTNAVQLSHTFEYAGGSGEMSKVTLPYGGIIRWAYRQFTYGGGKTVREVQYRYLTMVSGGTETTYSLTRDDANNPNNPVNGYTCVADPSGIGQKCWYFNTTASSWMMGLNTSIHQLPAAGQAVIQQQDVTWVQDGAGSPYVGTVLTTLDPTTANLQTKTTQVLDEHGNVLQTSVYDYGNLTTAARTYTNTYLTDPNYTSIGIWNRLVSSTVTNGSQTVTLVTNTYDGNSLTSVTGLREYVSVESYRGNVTTTVVPGRTVNTGYDVSGAAVSRNDGQGHTVSMTQSSVTNYAAPDVITLNGDSKSNQNMTYSGWLGLSTITGPNNTTVSTTYDSFARPATSTSVFGAVTNYGYSAGTVPYVTTATTNGHWTQTTLDGFGRTMKSVRGYASNKVSEVDTVYGSCACSPIGKVGQVSQPYVPGNTVYWTKYTYDGLGRTLTQVAPDGASTTTYAYSGNTTKITDPAGKWKKYTYDVFGNLKQVNEPNPASGADYVTTYTYDLLNHLTQVSMPRPTGTQTRTFVYDPATQRLTSETHPESGTKSYTYNADGTLASRKDAKGQVTKYSYDSYQRLTMKQYFPNPSYPTLEDLCQRVTQNYDTNSLDSTYSQNSWGRLTTAQWWGVNCPTNPTPMSGPFVQMYSYNSAGQVTGKRLRVSRSGTTYDLDGTFTYNNEGRMASVAYPITYKPGANGVPVAQPQQSYANSFDGMGRLNAMLNNQTQTNWPQSVQYGPSGEVVQISYSTSYTETRQYNSLVQLTRLTNPFGLDMQYGYPSAQNDGRVSNTVENITRETVNYTYDTLNRLTAATSGGSTIGGPWGETYTYDGFGNLTDKTPTAGSPPALHITVNAATNQINGDTYDANGNLISAPQFGGSYDVENRVVRSGDIYSYSPDNLRVWKLRSNSTEEIYYYDPAGRRLGVYRISTSGYGPYLDVVSTNVYFGGYLLTSSGTVVMDRLGSNVLGTRYYPYGEEYKTTTQDRDKFATYYRDGTTGLDYAKNRSYSPVLGRFMSADPYQATASEGNNPANPQSWNRYAYVLNDPVNFNDPAGLDASCVTCFIWNLGDVATAMWFAGLGGGQPAVKRPEQHPKESDVDTANNRVLSDLIDLRRLIDPDCLSFLENGSLAGGDLSTFNQYFNGLIGIGANGAQRPPLAGVADLGRGGPNAETATGSTTFGTGYVITINTAGAFFQASVGVGLADRSAAQMNSLVGGTVAAQNFILLHELAHFFGASGFVLDANANGQPIVAAQKKNNDLLWKHCKTTIKGPTL